MISLESQVLERHLAFFQDKAVLFAGGIKDHFPQQIQKVAKSVRIWSCYFDYARTNSAVDFSAVFNGDAELVVYYWTKNKQEVAFQLMQLLANASSGQELLIVGENRSGVRSAENLLAPYGEIAKIDGARRCGLYHFSLKNRPHFQLDEYWKTYRPLNSFTVYSLPGVFSAHELDAGTALLLSTLDAPINGKVLDLGCGVGVIGGYIKQRNPQVAITMTDIHAMALVSAERTLAENRLQGKVVASDVFSHIDEKFNIILSNPPFHDGIDTAYRAVETLIRQARQHLTAGGELRIVANAFLPYPNLLDEHFGTHQVLAKTGKFKVYSVRN